MDVMKLRRFGFWMVALALAALACRQGQPTNEPKPEPNSPLPKIEKPDDNHDDQSTSPPAPSLKKDAG